MKLPNQTPLEEPGGAGLGLVYAAEKAGMEATEHVVIDICEPGKALLDTNVAPAPTQGTSSIEPASRAMEATTIRPKALEPRVEIVEWSKLQLPPPPPLPYEDSGVSRTSP